MCDALLNNCIITADATHINYSGTNVMITADFHTHTTYCDGKNTPEEMVLAAIDKGMVAIGFSGHACTSFDLEWCMSRENTIKYLDEIDRLRDIYGSRIRIYHGAECDYYSDYISDRFEYRIGSVHYVEHNGVRKAVDDSPEKLDEIAESLFGGDYMALCENYYANVADVINRTGADIIGHFDLITKFNEVSPKINTNDERYIAAWKQAADKLLKTGALFEINTGAISRGYRTAPYPATDIMDYIGTKGGSFILSSDSHSTSSLLCKFDECERMIREKGYKLVTDIFR